MDKARVLAALREALAAELATNIAATTLALDEATNEESIAENKYDTRGLEASYLAGAQSERLLALKQLVSFWGVYAPPDFEEHTPIAAGALVQLDDGRHCLLAPSGGGRRVEVDGTVVIVVAPRTPLGQALLGCTVGEALEVRTPGGARTLEILAVY